MGFRSEFSAADYGEYYSSWWYSAIHIAVAIPDVHTVEDLSKLREMLLSLIKSSEIILRETADEELHLMLLDFYKL